MRTILRGFGVLGLAFAGWVAATGQMADRVGDTGFVSLRAESFRTMSPRQQEVAYWLTEAAIAIDPIFYDQLSSSGLREKRLLEEICAHPDAIDATARPKIEAFAKLFWANRGNHNLYTVRKFLPAFTAAELLAAAQAAREHGAFQTASGDLPPLADAAAVEAEIKAVESALFDPAFEPMITAKNPENGKDIIQASANTFYSGVSLADLKDFHGTYLLNSRVVKGADGSLTELPYRAGTPDGKIPPGLYATFLKRAVAALERAKAVAEPQQAAVLEPLIRYFQTGDYADWLAFGAQWVKSDNVVDFDNGFIEIYRDANAMKGSAQSFVCITDAQVTRAMTRLAQNAEYFEQKAPWLDQYKKRDFSPPVIKAVEVLAETGDFAATTIGDNLPNENEIREKYGSKNFLFTASARALKAAAGPGPNAEFYVDAETVARQQKYGDPADELLTALHEVIGHGSGKLSDRLKGGSEAELKEYFSTLEEARADLMALWNVWDPKLKELGLVENQEEIGKAMYDRAALNVLYQLRMIPTGNMIEEDHQRNRALITNYIADRTGAIVTEKHDGKTYMRVTDYQKMHEGVGLLLAELMRIKAEGDYAAIKALIDKYGIHFDPAVRDEIVARFKKLNLPAYWAGLNPSLTAQFDGAGKVTKVDMTYLDDPIRQYLNYGAMFDEGLR